ncbi:MAG: glycosyltransferase family 4 protein [Bdellovibrionales bacterium]|nr:glycosyltransferase family 4 protein [Bdellovibrionales bacterium]
MKVLFLMEHLYPLVGGAEKSIDTLIRALREEPDIEVNYLCGDERSETPKAVEPTEAIKANDIVVTQLNWAPVAIDAARVLGKKSIQFVRSYESFCTVAMDAFALSHCGQLCRGCSYQAKIEHLPDVLIANSLYTRKLLADQFGLESEVIYPFIDPTDVIAEPRERRFITMNQMGYHKGAEIFIRIAQKMPDLVFRIVGTHCWMPQSLVPPNVIYTGPMDAKEFYSDTLVFLAPFRIHETFGRCVVEAQMNGIPVICSDRGGPKGDKLVVKENRIADIDDIDQWVSAIRRVLASYDHYAAAAAARDTAEFGLAKNVKKFTDILRSLAPVQSASSAQHAH